jgi:hypothetical protein
MIVLKTDMVVASRVKPCFLENLFVIQSLRFPSIGRSAGAIDALL